MSNKIRHSSCSEKDLFMGYFYGEFTEHLARIKLSGMLQKGREFIDGHEPFEAPNFSALHSQRGIRPKNLDLVEIDSATGIVKAIYEVKSTLSSDKREFEVNGQCGMFMELARNLQIPTYLVVVRLDREINPDVLKENGSDITIDHTTYSEEIRHFLSNARFELYDNGQFRIREGKFSISDLPRILWRKRQ
ncbi:MAG: hypothetical protein M1569_02865 [Candidatus Marsarchaeota archaeon]|nr:hypothetical protein [Candidatus Marsarchaeota archaeon]MCL5413319.1 hypothetical protein [Candidatus Marsarchaeota archaeon]